MIKIADVSTTGPLLQIIYISRCSKNRPRRVRRGEGGGGWMDKGEGGGVGRFRPDIGRGGPQAPLVRICRAAEVTPTGVCICAAVHPGDRSCLLSNGGGYRNGVPPGTIRGRGRWSPREGYHPPASEAGGDGPPRPDADGP